MGRGAHTDTPSGVLRVHSATHLFIRGADALTEGGERYGTATPAALRAPVSAGSDVAFTLATSADCAASSLRS